MLDKDAVERGNGEREKRNSEMERGRELIDEKAKRKRYRFVRGPEESSV